MLLIAAGLVLFARAPLDGNLAVDVLPGMLLLGLGAGMSFNALVLAAMSGVAPSDSGLASGVVNTAFTMGGAIGLAVVVTIAAAHTRILLASRVELPVALNSGYHYAFCIGAVFAATAALAGGLFLCVGQEDRAGSHESRLRNACAVRESAQQ
jgi:hypothetical protein